MTDPNSIRRELDIILNQLLMQAAICPDKVDVHVGKIRDLVAPTLDAYARILAASPDVREIEARDAWCRAQWHETGYSKVAIQNANLDGLCHEPQTLTDALLDRATLLDVVRRKDAEAEQTALDLRLANEELKRLRVEHDQARVELNEAAAKIADQDQRITQLHGQREEARTALQEERERHAGTRAERDDLLSERTELTEAMGLTLKPDKQRSHITLMTQARTLRMSQEKRGLFVGKVVRDLCAALPEYKQKTGTLHSRWLECIAELRARLERAEEVVKLFRGPDRFNVLKVAEWEREHGAAAGKEPDTLVLTVTTPPASQAVPSQTRAIPGGGTGGQPK